MGHYRASWHLRLAYAASLLAAAFPIGLASTGRATFGSAFLMLSYFVPLAFLLLAIYRIVIVFRLPDTLDSPQVSGLASVFRHVGIAALYVGAIVGLINLLPVLHPGVVGVYGVYLWLIAGVAPLGILLFELSRLLGFESYARRGRLS